MQIVYKRAVVHIQVMTTLNHVQLISTVLLEMLSDQLFEEGQSHHWQTVVQSTGGCWTP